MPRLQRSNALMNSTWGDALIMRALCPRLSYAALSALRSIMPSPARRWVHVDSADKCAFRAPGPYTEATAAPGELASMKPETNHYSLLLAQMIPWK
jgi:hypothetical protein